MGKRGPKPKPTAIKKLQGNPSKRPLPENEPVSRVGDDEPPEHADLEPRARMVWDFLVPTLKAAGVYTQLDVILVIRYCETYAAWLDLREYLREKGHTIECLRLDEDGNTYVSSVRRSTESVRFREVSTALGQFEGAFGMSPSARTRIEVVPPEEGNSVQDSLDRALKLA